MRESALAHGVVGHNSKGVSIAVEVRMFNSLHHHLKGEASGTLTLPAGATVGDVVRHFGVPLKDIHLVLVNGRDISPFLGAPVETGRELEDGDVVALSGPVPFSWGYGAAIV